MFLTFAGYHYYPAGGWKDYVGTFATFNDAYKAGMEADGDWAHIVNLATNEIIEL
jgi:hypothetical protein